MRPFLRRDARAHDEVLLCRSPRRPSLREDHLVDENAGFGRHSWLDILQDLDTLVVRPVMQDVA